MVLVGTFLSSVHCQQRQCCQRTNHSSYQDSQVSFIPGLFLMPPSVMWLRMFRLFGRIVGVGNNKALLGIACNGRFVLLHLFFLDGVGNYFSIFLCIQVVKAAAPVVGLAQLQCLSGILSIGIQMDDYLSGTNLVFVIAVIPLLRNMKTGLSRCMSVGYIVFIGLRIS